MKTLVLALGALALVFALFAPPALAQYIYLDSNGDGVHTAADVLHGVGPTVLDIWLDTGHNRDGSVTHCQTSSGPSSTPLDMFSYDVSMQASGGTVSWSAYANRVPQMSALFIGRTDETRFYTGGFSAPIGIWLPPSLYHLGTLTVNVLSGTPRLDFVPTLPAPFYGYTMFGSDCDGTDFPNSIVLGTNWFDQDGLPFDAGGMANGSPHLTPPPDLQVASGENLTQPLIASDPDGQPLSFSKTNGPGFLFVTTTDAGAGTAQGEMRLAPFASDAGTTSAAVSVTDGAALDSKTFTVTVSRGAGHAPVLFLSTGLTVIAGRVGSRFLSAGDADGDIPRFTLISGPSYASVRETASHSGGASALLRAEPGLCDVGSALARVSASDGISEADLQIPLNVVAPSSLPDALTHLSTYSGYGFGIRVADMNGDGKLDAIITDDFGSPKVSVVPGLGNGSFGASASYAIASNALELTVADFDRNGMLDVVTANETAGSLSVLLGRGGGLLSTAVQYPTGASPEAVAAADFNRDGIPDLVSCNQNSGTVSVLLGNGDGTFRSQRDSAAGLRPGSLAVADFNLDGRLDVVVGNKSGDSPITVLPGLGDGSFGDPIPTTLNAFPISLSSADWNSDGIPDLVFTDFRARRVVSLLGHGYGTFAEPVFLTWPNATPYGTAVDDLNGDGIPDLAVGDANNENVQVFLGNGTGGWVGPTLAGVGVTLALGDVNSDGRPDFVTTTPGAVIVRFNRFGPANPALARAFVPGDNRSVTGNGNSDLVILVEPQDRSYTNEMLDFTSFTLASDGTGSASLIHNVPSKKLISADRDNDGVPEVGVTFAKSDIASLFDQLHGRMTVVADLAGALTDGRAFCTGVTLTNIGKGSTTQAVAASFAPNPLNPTSKLSFATERDGAARIRIFDVQGRAVRTLLDTPRLAAGSHELLFDGKTDRGAPLGSGAYFYRVESVDGTNEGHIVILK